MCPRETDREKDRLTGRDPGRGRERAGAETQLPTVELYCTVYKKGNIKRGDVKASAHAELYLHRPQFKVFTPAPHSSSYSSVRLLF